MPPAIGFEFEQLLKLGSEWAGELRFGNSKSLEVFLWKIDSAHLEIAAHIANDVGQLKRKAQALGQIRSFRIAKTENRQGGKSSRSCNTITVFRKAVEWGVGRNRQIHLRSQNQIMKIARGDLETRNGVSKRGEA